MREHLPSLLMRASALVHHMGHFYHNLVRLVEVGLTQFQGSPRIFERRAAKQSRTEAHLRENARPIAKRERRISAGGDPSSEVNAPHGSPPSAEKKGKLEHKKLIISIHIPKTGGTTFLEILKAITEEVLYLDYGNQIFSPDAVYRRGQKVQEPFESITDLELLPGRSVIHGHFHVGKYLGKFPEASYITWLRDPIERVVSHYFFWQRAADKHAFMADPLCNKVISEKMSLMEFAELERARNVQYRFLAPVGVGYCDFIGIAEEYDRSIKLFQRLFCPATDTTFEARNKNPERPRAFYKLEAGAREKILQLNELDVKTYFEGLYRFRSLCDEVGI
jgi:hypothetical protein